MPCGCFGTKDKVKSDKNKKEQSPPSFIETCPVTVTEEKSQDDGTEKTAKRRDVVASYYEDECALLGYRPTGSRPPSSSYVDSPTSHTHTPSTAPITTSSTLSSQQTSLTASPSNSYARKQASCRAQLAEKRMEFFRDFYPEVSRSSPHYLPSTLPTVARARQFGKVKTTRPLSQPNNHVPPAPIQPSLPPGPHLLRPSTGSRVSSKIDYDVTGHEGGFTSPDFLLELKNASEEISRRWAMSEEEKTTLPSTLKMRDKSPKLFDHVVYNEIDEQSFNYDSQKPSDSTELKYDRNADHSETQKNYDECVDPSYLPYSLSFFTQATHSDAIPIQSNFVPQTLVTPPSPPTVDESLSMPGLVVKSESDCLDSSKKGEYQMPEIESEDEENYNTQNYPILNQHSDFQIEEISEVPITSSSSISKFDEEQLLNQANINYSYKYTQDERRENNIEGKGISLDFTSNDHRRRDEPISATFFELPLDPQDDVIRSTPIHDDDFDIEVNDAFEEFIKVETSTTTSSATPSSAYHSFPK